MNHVGTETPQLIPSAACRRARIALLRSPWQIAAIGVLACTAWTALGNDSGDSEQYQWACTTVDKETGEPIGGVHIAWEFRRPHPIAEGVDPVVWKKEFVSDRNGNYEVNVPKSAVDAAQSWIGIAYHHPRYLPSRESLWPLRMPDDPVGKGLDHRHAKLEPGVEVSGVVVNPDGSPARFVPVMFSRNRDGFGDFNGGYRHGFWTRTGEDGRYLLYTRNTWPQRIHWFPEEYEANSRALTKTFGEQERIRLRRGLTLTGRITDAQDSPLEGIVVKATMGTRVPYLFATSDTDGVFRFSPLPAGTYYLSPVRSYHDNATGDSLSAELPHPIPSIKFELSDTTSSKEPKAVIQAAPLVKIPVEVVDGDGHPMSNERLSIGDTSNFINAVLAKSVEGSPGSYEFRFPRNQYIRDLKLRRSMDEAAFYQLNREHPPVAAEAIVLGKAAADLGTIRVVVRKAAVLSVKVRTSDGKQPEEPIQVDAEYGSATGERIEAAERANRNPQAHFMAPRMIHTHPANQPWNPTFQHLVPGEPIVVVVRSDHYIAQPMTITLKDGEKRTVELLVNKKT